MRKFLSLTFAVLFCASTGFAQTTQNRWPVVIGVNVPSVPGALNDALIDNTYLSGFSFFPSSAKTVAKVRAYMTMTGTVTDLQADIYSDTAGTPNASLSHVHKTTGLTTGVQEFTGLSQATASHTLFWVTFTNNTGTPASNYPTIAWTYSTPLFPNGNTIFGWAHRKYTTSWGSVSGGVSGVEVEYSDGSVDGWLAYTASSSTVKVYDSGAAHSELAASFTTPANTNLNVRGIGFYGLKSGTPPSGLKFALYASSGHTALGTTGTIPAANISTTANAPQVAYLPATVTLSAGTVYKGSAIYDGADGDTSNYYRIYTFTIANNAMTRSLGPMATTTAGSEISRTSWDGSNWAALTNTEIPIFVLILDTDGPFPAVTGGGGTGRVISE
jgi:hypothetical protein